jgi:hypothetical protein
MIVCPGNYETLWGTACWRQSVTDLTAYDKHGALHICRECEKANGGCEEDLAIEDRGIVKLRVHLDD